MRSDSASTCAWRAVACASRAGVARSSRRVRGARSSSSRVRRPNSPSRAPCRSSSRAFSAARREGSPPSRGWLGAALPLAPPAPRAPAAAGLRPFSRPPGARAGSPLRPPGPSPRSGRPGSRLRVPPPATGAGRSLPAPARIGRTSTRSPARPPPRRRTRPGRSGDGAPAGCAAGTRAPGRRTLVAGPRGARTGLPQPTQTRAPAPAVATAPASPADAGGAARQATIDLDRPRLLAPPRRKPLPHPHQALVRDVDDSSRPQRTPAGGIRKARPGARKTVDDPLERSARSAPRRPPDAGRGRAAHAAAVRRSFGQRLEEPLGDPPLALGRELGVGLVGMPGEGLAPWCRSPRSAGGRAARRGRGRPSQASQVRISACCRTGSWSGSSPTSFSSRGHQPGGDGRAPPPPTGR